MTATPSLLAAEVAFTADNSTARWKNELCRLTRVRNHGGQARKIKNQYITGIKPDRSVEAFGRQPTIHTERSKLI